LSVKNLDFHPHLLAERIDTGLDDPEISRALVVFNGMEQPQSGIALFQADMSWPRAVAFPSVIVHELYGEMTPSALVDWQEGPDKKGRADRKQIHFVLRFVVYDIPPQGWRTYIAAYTDMPIPNAPIVLADSSATLLVVETLRHAGDLPPAGTVNAGR
jgi:hypothetical protein